MCSAARAAASSTMSLGDVGHLLLRCRLVPLLVDDRVVGVRPTEYRVPRVAYINKGRHQCWAPTSHAPERLRPSRGPILARSAAERQRCKLSRGVVEPRRQQRDRLKDGGKRGGWEDELSTDAMKVTRHPPVVHVDAVGRRAREHLLEEVSNPLRTRRSCFEN